MGVNTSFWIGALWDTLWGRFQAVQKAVDFIPQMDQFSTQVLHLRRLQGPGLSVHCKHTSYDTYHISSTLTSYCVSGLIFVTSLNLALKPSYTKGVMKNVLIYCHFVNKWIKIISITRLYDEVIHSFGFVSDLRLFFPKSICLKLAAAWTIPDCSDITQALEVVQPSPWAPVTFGTHTRTWHYTAVNQHRLLKVFLKITLHVFISSFHFLSSTNFTFNYGQGYIQTSFWL